MPEAPGLQGTQELVWRLITAPEGVASAPERAAIDGTVRGDETLSAERRLEIYANAYFERIHDCLCDDYRALAAAIGEAPFHDLATSYLAVRPPRHPSLRWAGSALPGFLRDHGAGEPFRRRWPFSPDLAAFEWAMSLAFDARDATHATRDALAATAPERWADLALALVPSVQLLDLGWPVHALRRACDAVEPQESAVGDALPTLDPHPTRLCVWRRDERVFYRTLDSHEWRSLGELASGTSFGALCEACARDFGEDEAPARAAAWLGQWVEDGLVAG